MPPRKDLVSSPYFKSTPTRKSTRVSVASTPSAKKRKAAESEPDSESNFESGGEASESDFEKEQKGKGKKKVRRDEDYESESDAKDDDQEDEAESDSDDESKPMKRTVIPLPKLRDEGEVSYEDGKLHQNTLLFLKDLKKHNNREWMKCVANSLTLT